MEVGVYSKTLSMAGKEGEILLLSCCTELNMILANN